jgi:uncharacterized damage-inducible protein DinB
MSNTRRQLVIAELASREPEIGRWLWCMEDTRARTKQRLDGMNPALVDWTLGEGANSIGSILYHIAAIEADYLYADLLEQPFPQDIVELFPYEVREESGQLTPVHGFELQWYLHRLDETRSRLLAVFGAMDPADFRRVRHREAADITPDWTLHHLLQHEAEHRGEIAVLRARAEALRA